MLHFVLLSPGVADEVLRMLVVLAFVNSILCFSTFCGVLLLFACLFVYVPHGLRSNMSAFEVTHV